MNEMHAESPFLCDYLTSRNGFCKREMIKTAESNQVFKKISNYTKNEYVRTM